MLFRVEPQRLPHLLEAEAEVFVQKIGDAWGKVANMPPGAELHILTEVLNVYMSPCNILSK